MTPLTIPELVTRASALPFLGEHLTLGRNTSHEIAHVHLRGLTANSAYEPIYDVTMLGTPQSTSLTDAIERFGDELGFQAVTQLADAPFDPFDAELDDQTLIALDRLIRALHTINFFGAQRHGLLFLRVHERLLKSVKYDHGKYFSSILETFGLNPERVVIELPATAVAHQTFLGHLTKSYQYYGFRVADNLSDPGRILAVISEMARPDYIKVNTAMALRAGMVKALVSYAHQIRIPLILDRVVDETQFALLRQYDVQFMQGPLFTHSVAA